MYLSNFFGNQTWFTIMVPQILKVISTVFPYPVISLTSLNREVRVAL